MNGNIVLSALMRCGHRAAEEGSPPTDAVSQRPEDDLPQQQTHYDTETGQYLQWRKNVQWIIFVTIRNTFIRMNEVIT